MNAPLNLRELFLIILLVATVSLFLNIQASNYGTVLSGGKLIFTANVSYETGSDVIDVKRTFKIGGGRSLNQHGPDVASLQERTEKGKSNELLHRLTQIEARLMAISKHPIIGLVHNNVTSDVMDRARIQNIPLKMTNTRGRTRLNWISDNTVIQGSNWSVLLCGDSSPCPEYTTLRYKKINRIKVLEDYINNSSKLCRLSRNMYGEFQDIECSNLNKNDQRRGKRNTDAESQTYGHNRAYSMNRTVVQSSEPLFKHERRPLFLSTSGELLRLRIVISSMTPLRFYIHPSALAGPIKSPESRVGFNKVTVEDVLQFISESYGLGMSSRWWITLQKTLVRYLARIRMQGDRRHRCDRCFMEIQADLICTSIERCRLIQLKDVVQRLTSHVVDLPPIASLDTSSVQGVNMMLQDLQVCNNQELHDCLSEPDLIYILDNYRERLVEKSWIKIFPSKDGSELYAKIDDVNEIAKLKHSTLTNQILSTIEKYYHQLETDTKNTLDIPYDTDVGINSSDRDHKDLPSIENNFCSKDLEVYKDIESINTEPTLVFNTIGNQHLYTEVPYSTSLVRVWAIAKHCQCVVKLDNKYSSPGARNISIGLGNNTIHLLVVDRTLADPRVVRVVTLTVHRRTRETKSVLDSMVTCQLKQDCTLPYNKWERCGLQPLTNQNIKTDRCQTGDQEGRWLVPCSDCDDAHSCRWSNARWQPFRCSYRQHSMSSLKQCLRNKKLLFVGDSTNRGIMNYILEQINGTLRHWDKIHNTRAFTNINDNSSHFSFAYYPHFWLPAAHRPKFQKIIYQLIKSSLPLHNNASTVLVVGGVQWLAREHIDSIIEALKRKGLSNITVVVKGLGAGFHQPIEGVRFVPPEQQPVLQQKESSILSYARDQGFRVVATFNMTLARYQDFQEGKCACHFHKVSKVTISKSGSTEIGYSISGDVNAAYSNIVAEQICR